MPNNKYRRNNEGKKLSTSRKISEEKFDEKQNICSLEDSLYNLLTTKGNIIKLQWRNQAITILPK